MATLYILYGSATGNAEQIAKDLAEKPLPSQFSSVVCKPLNDFKKFTAEWDNEPKYGRKHGLILISSTTGNGDAPENASGFIRFIKRKQTAETQPFRHCAVAVLGLGDTNYDNFCAMGKAIDMKVTELGAERAMPLACADDATGLEDVVEPWLDDVFVNINAACGSEPGLVEEETKEEAQLVEDDSPAASSSSKPLPSKSDSPLYIMYGSATGNSEQIAKDLAASYERLLENPDALTFFPSVVCCELYQFKKHLPLWEEENAGGSKHGLLIVASTTGNAEAPENCSRFMSFIKRRQNMELQPFRNVCFAVLVRTIVERGNHSNNCPRRMLTFARSLFSWVGTW
jgi:sulfite reductase alpha subunit-like flavoprotein